MIFRRKKQSQEALYTATQWKLIRVKFMAHKPALWSLYFLFALYFVAIFAGFFSVNDPVQRRTGQKFLPPTKIHWFDDGSWSPHVYPRKRTPLDPITLERKFIELTDQPARLRFLPKGQSYSVLGLFEWNRHLLGTEGEKANYFPLGTDGSGRCVYSRLLVGAQLSLSIGMLAVGMTFFLGIFIGGISGYFGGFIDNAIQRLIEVLMSFPSLPLWMALSASLPLDWSIIKIYFAISMILSIMGWTGLARTVRSKFLALREEEFVLAARLDGAGPSRLTFRHMLPSFASHLIVSASLAIPGMILGETTLSFLGIGLRPPAISWGVLLQDAQNVEAVALHPWLLTPAVAVILVVVAFNFMGDGLRDAADPYR
jgi:peptide/nickel transport system permease protein